MSYALVPRVENSALVSEGLLYDGNEPELEDSASEAFTVLMR